MLGGYWGFYAIYIDTVSIKPITSRVVGGWRSKLVIVVSGVPQGSILGSLLFLLYTLEFFSVLENKLIGFVDYSTLMALVRSPDVRVTVAESLIRDLWQG